MLSLLEKYNKEVIPVMREKFGYKSVMAVPRIEKVVVNTGFGKLISGKTSDEQKKTQELILQDIASVCGQKPVLRAAKQSIAAFKIRQGQGIGVSCTLRKKKMYDFIERLINIVLPRSRDFRGIDQSSIDKQGNLSLGIKEHIAFPEISPEKAKAIFGLEITIATSAKNKEKGLALLKLMGFPIK